VRWAKAPASDIPGMDFLLVESTGRRYDEYRSIGQFGLKKLRVSKEGAVMYGYITKESEAYEAVIREKWRRGRLLLFK
jgi:hypothetical protein